MGLIQIAKSVRKKIRYGKSYPFRSQVCTLQRGILDRHPDNCGESYPIFGERAGAQS